MPTVIDSLVVELGLDASKFTLQQREALETAKRLEEQQVKTAKNVEYSAGRAGDAIGGVKTQALEMLAVLTGGAGLVSFGVNLTHANAQLGRLERSTGISASTISKWSGVARIMGGDAEGMARSFVQVSDAFAGWKMGVENPMIADLRAISTAGGKVIDVNKGVEQSFIDLGENLRNISKRDPDQAGYLGRRLGLDPGMFDAMITGNVEKLLKIMKELGVTGREDIDVFGELEKRIGLMGLKGEQIGRKVLGGEGGVASAILELSDILNMSPSDAWAYLNKPGRKALGQNRGTGEGTGPGSNLLSSGGGTGAFTSQSEKEQYIRAAAAKRGINPNVAMEVARREGFNNFQSTVVTANGSREQSFGAFQLYMGGGLGNEFQKRTGLDPSDRKNERQGIDFALDDVTKHGWTAFHGAKNNGIGQWQGVDRNGGSSSSTTTTEINITGPITITPPAGANADQFAATFKDALLRQGRASQANSGAQ